MYAMVNFCARRVEIQRIALTGEKHRTTCRFFLEREIK